MASSFVATIVNHLVMRRLPAEAQSTERVDEALRCARCRLRAETDALLDELIGPKGSDDGPVHR